MAVTIPADKSMRGVRATYQDRDGNPAVVNGAPVWSSSDEGAIFTIEPAADGLSADIFTVGPLGSAQVKVVADADMGDGVKPLELMETFEVVAGEAFAGGIQPGTLEDEAEA